MPEDTRRYISRIGRTEGPFTVDEIFDKITAREIGLTTLFWSEKKQAWKAITGLMLDIDPDHLDQFLEAGVKQVKVVSSGDKDCYYCARLVNKVFPISKQPVLPPIECNCIPWCRLVVTPVTDS